MAFSGENSYIAWQRVKILLAGANPTAVRVFKELKAQLSQVGGNPDLQVLPFTEAQADAAGGTSLLTGAATLLAVYVKKENSATDNHFKLYDDATDDSTDGDAIVALPLLTANEEAVYLALNGVPLATGIVVTQHTTLIGTTDGSNGGGGFVIIKA